MSNFLQDEIPVSELLQDTASSFWLNDGARRHDGSSDDGYDDGDEYEDDDDDGYIRRDDQVVRTRPDDSDLILRRGRGMDQLDRWQVDSAKATWFAMRNIMPAEVWMTY